MQNRIFAKLGIRQFENGKGSSTVHYLAELISYITSNEDKRLEMTVGKLSVSSVTPEDDCPEISRGPTEEELLLRPPREQPSLR